MYKSVKCNYLPLYCDDYALATVEVQTVREVGVAVARRRRPVAAARTNVVELPTDVVAQGGQVEVVGGVGRLARCRSDSDDASARSAGAVGDRGTSRLAGNIIPLLQPNTALVGTTTQIPFCVCVPINTCRHVPGHGVVARLVTRAAVAAAGTVVGQAGCSAGYGVVPTVGVGISGITVAALIVDSRISRSA